MKDGVTQSSFVALTQILMSINSSNSDLMYTEHSSLHKEGNNNTDFFFFSIFFLTFRGEKDKKHISKTRSANALGKYLF